MAKDDREVAIVGVGQTDFKALYQNKDTSRDAFGLAAEALKIAIDDAGIQKSEIDGLITSWVDYQRLATVVDLGSTNVVYDLQGAGRMSGVAVQQAAALIKAGEAEVIALVYGNNGRSVKMSYGGGEVSPLVAYDAMYGMTSAGAEAATAYRRYQHLYGAPDGALAPLAMNNRANAALNPVAVMQKQFTEEEYLASRFVAEPLRLFDYCIINDGGVALIMTTMERARTMAKRPVKLAATASRGDLWNFYASKDFFFDASQDVAKRVYERSGYGPDDMDALEIYDNFTPTILFSLEGFGHAPRGEGWRFVKDGRIALTGEKPINTAGGHTGESYMQGWSHHVEAVRQVRGEAGERQVPDCNVVQYMASTPITSSHVFVGA
jgi:acetyl-CoA acetyltransferase